MQHESEVVIASGTTGSAGKYDGFNAKLTTRNVEDNIKLIELIKDCPILYDSTLPGYKDTAQKEESWQNIARSMLWPVELCQTRWKSLRDSFRKKDKKIFGGGQDNTPSNSPTWRYRELLSFLRDKNYRRRDHHSDPLSYDSPTLVGRRTISCSDQINFRMSPSDFDTPEDSNHHHLSNDQAAPDYHHFDDSSSCNGNDVKLEIAQNTLNSDLDENNEDSDSRNGVTAAIPVVRDVDETAARVESPCAGGGVISVVNGISVLDENNDRSPPTSDDSPTVNQQENVLAALGLTAAAVDGAGENLRASPSTTTIPSLIMPPNSTGVQRISPKSAQRILQALASSSNKRKSTIVNHHSNQNSSLNHQNDSTTMINLKRHKTTSTNSHINHVAYPNRTSSINHHSPRNGCSAVFPTNVNSSINNSGQDTVLPNSNSYCNNNGVQDFFFRKEYDEDDLFGLSIAASLKKCTEDQKLAAKIEIMRILHVAQH